MRAASVLADDVSPVAYRSSAGTARVIGSGRNHNSAFEPYQTAAAASWPVWVRKPPSCRMGFEMSATIGVFPV